jgi:thiamine biosynthesis lipoprotein
MTGTLHIVRRARPLLGTLVDMAVRTAGSEAAAHAAIGVAFAEIAAVHHLMSFHEADSDLSRLNRAAVGEALEVDARTATVLQAALRFWQESDGAFDCTVAPLLVAGGTLPAVPGGTGTSGGDTPPFSLDGNTVTKQRPFLADLGGIAKGHAVDRAVALLAAQDFTDVVVNAGGDLRHAGRTPQPVQLRDPRDPSRIATTVLLDNAALASSAVYGARHDTTQASALVDARRGSPLVRDGGVSLTAPDAMTADALTKVVLVSGNDAHPLLARCGARVLLFA